MNCSAPNRMTGQRCHKEAVSNGYCEIHQEEVVGSEIHRCEVIAKTSKRQCVKTNTHQVGEVWLCALHDPNRAESRRLGAIKMISTRRANGTIGVVGRGGSKKKSEVSLSPAQQARRAREAGPVQLQIPAHSPTPSRIEDVLTRMIREEIRQILQSML